MQPFSTSPLHAWQGRTAWHLLDTEFGHGERFLAAWAAWQADPQRCPLLHVTGITDGTVHPAQALSNLSPDLAPLAQALAQQLHGLLPGVHRLSFAQGRVLLTLWVGDVHSMLRLQSSVADAVWLSPTFAHDAHSIKALARHCQRGTVVHSESLNTPLQQALQSGGFVLEAPSPDAPINHARFDPRWEPRTRAAQPLVARAPGHALVIGAGLAGAATAHSLALRGWQVTVLAAGDTPADGASGLPAGLFCPHVSPDDSVLSRLSRSGVRLTLQRLRDLCQEGEDWGHTGVLEHCTDGGTGLPAHWASGPGQAWSHATDAATLQAAGLPPETVACWHAQAGWVRPAQLVHAQLAHAHIVFRGQSMVAKLHATEHGTWQALAADGRVLGHGDIAIVAGGPATLDLLPQGTHWPLQAIRGQITWGFHSMQNAYALPPFPVNGNGNLVTHIPLDSGQAWVMGSTFERDVTQMPISEADQAAAHAVNHAKLSTLLPASGAPLAPWFDPQDSRCQPTWGHVRCASHDRLPIAGPVSAAAPGLWAHTALGARGLTLSVLCAELIAAQLHGEPLPLDAKLAQHVGTQRLARAMRHDDF
ncbi:MAG: FAD-dependent 5-carboxymethylaminomethyl-2-thiouridine(34) oxidoreductase MnmC [Comamonas sp.]|nr:FAD-dependent 5-carboxymethylaminomethyl-2-thiouridine(34) oxidoreductase MnmC [Candidatus Comamonas equi]